MSADFLFLFHRVLTSTEQIKPCVSMTTPLIYSNQSMSMQPDQAEFRILTETFNLATEREDKKKNYNSMECAFRAA